MHLKRQNIGEFWPVPRKGTKYLSVATHNQEESMPLVIVMRDILKVVRNKKELKRILNEKQVFINDKEIRETNFPLCLFDVLSLPKMNLYYRALLSKNKKMIFEKISEKDAGTKVYKVTGRKILPGKVMQLNLMHGRNINSKEKISTGDSVVINFKENKITKVIPLEKGKKVFIIMGAHAGHDGKIEEIVSRGGKSIAKISSGKGRINVWVKNLVAIE